MADEKITRCLECGGTLEPNPKTGVPTCIYCGREFKHSVDDFSIDIKSIVDLRQSREFIQAEERCAELRQKQPESSEVHWQSLLSELGVVYVTEGNEAKPTFFSYSYNERESVLENEHYKNAIKFSTSEDRAYYEKKANEIDFLLKEFFNLVAKEDSYDIFISFKKSIELTAADGEKVIADTQDYKKAEEIYNKLKDKYRVFFSPVSIGKDTGISGEKYEPRILKALQTSQAMILIGTKTEYLEAQWVQNEWRRYQYFINKGIKKKNSLILGYLNNMPRLPIALKDTQWPNFDMFDSDYIKEVYKMLEQAQVKSSKGLASSIKRGKVDRNFGANEVQFGTSNVERVKIGGNKNTIQISASEERDFQTAETMRNGGRLDEAEGLYQGILRNNPNSARAWWGLFCTQIKAKNDTEVAECLTSRSGIKYDAFHKAIETSSDTAYAFKLVDIVTSALKVSCPWKKRETAFNEVRKYLDDARVKKALTILGGAIAEALSTANTADSEQIYESACNIFFEENREQNITFIEKYANALLEKGIYSLASKHLEQLIGARKNANDYIGLLKCRLKTNDVENAKIVLNSAKSEAKQDEGKKEEKKPLTNEQIIERAMICSYDGTGGSVAPTLRKMALYQIPYNKPYAKPFIEIVASCIQQLGSVADSRSFYFDVADRYLQIKDFKNAEIYYSEILVNDQNVSKAHWGLLKCQMKVLDDVELAGKKSATRSQHFNNAKNCATASEYDYYMKVLTGKGSKERPFYLAYRKFTKTQRSIKNAITAAAIALIIGVAAYVGVGIANPILYNGNETVITGKSPFFNLAVSDLELSVNEVEAGALKGTGIKTITVKNGLTSIGSDAFKDCKKLVSVRGERGNGILRVESSAFEDCTSLREVELHGISFLGENAFSGCTSMQKITISCTQDATISENAFLGLPTGTVISLPSVSEDTILTLESHYPELVFETFTLDAVDETIYFINEIGTVTLDSSSLQLIERAESAYNALTDEQKAYVTNQTTLTNARSIYTALEAIENIGTVSLDKLDKIILAESAYATLSNALRPSVYNYDTLANARAVYDVMLAIDEIGEVTIEKEDEIYSVLDSYNALTEWQKQAVSNYDTFASAISEVDSIAAGIVDSLILGVTDPTSDPISLENAYNAYNSLKVHQRELVENIEALDALVDEYGDYMFLFTYTSLLDGTYAVSLGTNKGFTGELIIPSTYGGISVTRINQISNNTGITAVQIPEGVSSIAGNAFEGCTALKTINFPSTVATIGASAFEDCTDLEAIELSGVEAIGASAFKDCVSLSSIDFGNRIQSIGVDSFKGCTSVTEINVPSSVTSIAMGAFNGCSGLQSITLPFIGSSAGGISSMGNRLFGYIFGTGEYVGAQAVEQYYTDSDSATYYIPSALSEVVITGGEIPYGAFYGCSMLSSIAMPSTVTEIGDHAFFSCSKITGINIPNSVETIGAGAFENCTQINNVSIPDSVTVIGDYAFMGATALEGITIGTSLGEIGTNAFFNCTNLTEVCNLSSLIIDAGSTAHGYVGYYASAVYSEFESIGGYLFITTRDGYYLFGYEGTETELTLPQNYNGNSYAIYKNAFLNNTAITSVVIPNTVTGIGQNAFNGCSSLESITIPFVGASASTSASASTLFGYIFGTSSYTGGTAVTQKYSSSGTATYYVPNSLKEVTVTGGNILYGAFYGCTGLTDITLPSTASSLGAYALYNCSGIASIAVPNSVTSIGSYAFSGCSTLSSVNLGTGVTALNEGVFQNCTSISSIQISNITSIGSNVFNGCTKLNGISFNSNLTSIGANAFKNCTRLANVTIPNKVTSIGAGAFSGCTSLESLTIPFVGGSSATNASASTLFGYIFGTSNYTGGTAVTQRYSSSGTATYYVPNSLTEVTVTGGNILYGAFYGCTGLTDITLPSTASSLGAYALYNCSGIASIAVPNSVTSIGSYAFSGCSTLSSVNLGTGVTALNEGVFQNCTSISSIQISNITSIGANVFNGCTKLNGISFNSNLTSIGANAFKNCTKLANVTIPNKVTSIGANAFQNCTTFTGVTFGTFLTSIGASAFSGCSNIESISVPSNVTSIGSGAFSGCTSLESLTIPFVGGSSASSASASTLFGYIFGTSSYTGGTAVTQKYSSSGTATYYVPSSLKEVTVTGGNILYGAFYGCTGLTDVTIGDSVTSIGDNAFNSCSSLKTLAIGNGVITLPSAVLYGCGSLESVTIPFVGGSASETTASASTLFGYIFGTTNYTGATAVTQKYSSSGSVTYYVPDSLTEVTVTGGGILSGAFYSYTGLTSVTIGDSVTSIGNSAFKDCTGLTEINFNATAMSDLSSYNYAFYNAGKSGNGITVSIGANATKIPAYLFAHDSSSYAPKITKVVFEENGVCESIGSRAFEYCSEINTLNLGEGLKTIGERAFYYCTGLTEINFNATAMSDLGYRQFAYAGTGGSGITVNIGNNVTKIPAYLFSSDNGSYGAKITKVVFGENSACESIGNSAFYGCTGLTEVHISSIESWCNIEFDYAAANPLYYAEKLYLNGNLVTELEIPNTVSSIGAYAFYGCEWLTSVTIGDSVTSIGAYAFNCTGLTEINFNATAMSDLSYYNYVFYNAGASANGITVNIGNNVTRIPAYLFSPDNSSSYASKITKVVFEENSVCESIGDNAFYNCTGLTEVHISSVESWCNIKFAGYSANPLYYAKKLYLNGNLVTALEIPNTVTSIGEYAFYNCTGLTSVTLGKNVSLIGSYAFSDCYSLIEVYNLSSLSIVTGKTSYGNIAKYAKNVYTASSGESKLVYQGDYVLYVDEDNNEYYIVKYLGSSNTLVLMDKINNNNYSIYAGAFINCKELTSITIPDSVTSIGDYAFSGCTGLTSIEIPNSVTKMGSAMLGGCSSLSSLTIPFVGIQNSNTASSTTLFGVIFGNISYNGGTQTNQYYNSESYKTYYIPSRLKNVTVAGGNILYGAFSNCSNLTSVTVGEGTTLIESAAFSGCSGLKSMTIPFVGASLYDGASISQTAFGYIFGRASYTGSTSVIQYFQSNSGYTYYIPTSLRTVSVTGGNLYYGAFMNCSMLTSVQLGDGVKSVGVNAFSGCTSLNYNEYDNAYYLGNTNNPYFVLVKSVNSSITTCDIHEDTVIIAGSAFNSCNVLTSLEIPNGIISIGENAFYYCNSLAYNQYDNAYYLGNATNKYLVLVKSINKEITSCTIHTGTKIICPEAFSDCTALESIVIPNGVTSIGNSAFEGCTGLISVEIPNTVTSIGRRAFYDCTLLASIALPDGVISIESQLFANCTSLTNVSFGDRVISIGASAFYACTGLTDVVIPSTTTIIGANAFSGCTGLTSITIPENVTTIDNGAFYGCRNLKSVTFENTTSWIAISSSENVRLTLTNTTTNATYLRSTYEDYCWKRS